jgi:hypothetical protein
MNRRRQILVAVRIAASFLLAFAFVRSSVAQDRVIAVGDVHGSYPQFVHILQQSALIDARL